MYLIYVLFLLAGYVVFSIILLSFSASLLLSLLEILLSSKAIELELSDMEGLEDPSVMEYLKKKFERED
jgi:hypothetical protein